MRAVARPGNVHAHGSRVALDDLVRAARDDPWVIESPQQQRRHAQLLQEGVHRALLRSQVNEDLICTLVSMWLPEMAAQHGQANDPSGRKALTFCVMMR